MKTLLIGLFLIAHGLLHLSFLSPAPPKSEGGPEWPFVLTKSWLLSPLGFNGSTLKVIGTILALVTGIAFAIAGVGRLGAFDGWEPFAIVGARRAGWCCWCSTGICG